MWFESPGSGEGSPRERSGGASSGDGPSGGGGQRRIAVLISGGGTTLHNLLKHQRRLPADFEVGLVVSSSAGAAGLDFARQAEVPWHVVPFPAEQSPAVGAAEIFSLCRQHAVDLVVLGGFLKRLAIPEDFRLRVINIHPSLIPAFSGQGFFGSRVHRAVLDYGCRVTGCTVHFVDDHYDQGPIIAQQVVPVMDGDTVDSLQGRVFQEECDLYPRVIRAVLDGRVRPVGRWVQWDE